MASTLLAARPPQPDTVRDVPLCVDLDGTLIHTDLLFESLLAAIRHRWWIVFLAPFWLLKGRAHLKHRLASVGPFDPALLPYREDFLAWLREEHSAGRQLILATGSTLVLAEAVSRHLGIFDRVMASDEKFNLTGHRKADRLIHEFGAGGFDYAGDSSADIAVWKYANRLIAAGAAVNRKGHCFHRSFADRRSELRALAKQLRPKHWVKNVLVFVPLLAGHKMLEPAPALRALAAFFAFSLSASAVYVVNDLLDLASDRKHPIKKNRPFAAGSLPLKTGFWVAPLLLAAGLAISATLGAAAFGVLAFYLALTFVYTFYLKRKLLTDVFALALLYTLRMLEGGAATGVLCSTWLLAFSVFQFLSLAFLKRSAELSRLARSSGSEATGRGYFTWDLLQVNAFGVTAAYLSSLVLGLYVTGETVRTLYREPAWLWVLVPLHLYWMSRAWILSHRGAMNEDPILFAFGDRATWLCGIIATGILALATRGGIPLPGVAW